MGGHSLDWPARLTLKGSLSAFSVGCDHVKIVCILKIDKENCIYWAYN